VLAHQEEEMPFFDRDGAQLYYEVHGQGPPIVFAHGAGGNHTSWWQQVPHFQDRYTCVTFAHRGFTPSTDRAGGPGREAFVDDIAALIDHLDLGQVRLVAQSMGGWSCLGYALRHPERVHALVMASTTGGVGGLISNDEAARLRAGKPTREDLLARGINPGAGERMTSEQPALAYLYSAISSWRDARLAEPRGGAAPRPSIEPERLASLTMPVLCLAGEEDTTALPAAQEAFSRRCPKGRYAVVPAAGHSVYFERAEQFNRILAGFLAEVDA
jgi:3-oxoadipate enol-lactonase